MDPFVTSKNIAAPFAGRERYGGKLLRVMRSFDLTFLKKTKEKEGREKK